MERPNPEPASTGHPWRLLLCDDSDIERDALARFLRPIGFEVEEVADGKTGLAHLKNRPVDLLILDLHMPGIDGFQVLSYLQKHRPGLPVILLSGMPVDQIQHQMRRLPKQELPPLLIKPINPTQVQDLIEDALAGDFPMSEPPQQQ